MEKKVTPPWQIAIIVSLILILANIVMYITNQFMNRSLANLQLVVILIAVIIGCIIYAKENKGEVTYGNIFAHGFKITAGITALLAIYIYISIKFIHPEIIDLSLEQSRIEMEKSGKLTTDQIDDYLKLTRNNFLSFSIGFSTFIMALVGVIASLIGAGVAKKNPINPFEKAS